MKIGVLALQGDFEAHARAVERAGGAATEVRHVRDLDAFPGLVIPGGESTTLLKLMEDEPWLETIRAFHDDGGAILGTCAGAILLAREVVALRQASIGLLDAAIERNAYGRQIDSFEAVLSAPRLGGTVRGVFIRAPRFRRLGAGVETIVEREGEPVGVRQGRVVALTFHPELTSDDRLHRYFLDIASRGRGAAGSGRLAAAAP